MNARLKLFLTMLGLCLFSLQSSQIVNADEKKADDKKVEAKAEAAAGDDKLVPVEFKLPKPAYAGTPKTLPRDSTASKPTGKPRPKWMAPEGVKNLSLKKPVTSSDKDPIIGKVDQVTDGDKEGSDGSWVELAPGLQWVQIDLQQPSTIYGLLVWHHHGDPRIYRDVVVQICDDPDFITNVQTVYNNDQDNSAGLGVGKDREFFESFEGQLIEVKGVKGRYVRLYSKGSTTDDQNHYTEVEVWGLPAK
jgi:hypothetical protein